MSLRVQFTATDADRPITSRNSLQQLWLGANRQFAEAAWAAEIERRAADARANPDDDEDWRTVLDEIQREVSSR